MALKAEASSPYFRLVAFCEKWSEPGADATRYLPVSDVPIPDWDLVEKSCIDASVPPVKRSLDDFGGFRPLLFIDSEQRILPTVTVGDEVWLPAEPKPPFLVLLYDPREGLAGWGLYDGTETTVHRAALVKAVVAEQQSPGLGAIAAIVLRAAPVAMSLANLASRAAPYLGRIGGFFAKIGQSIFRYASGAISAIASKVFTVFSGGKTRQLVIPVDKARASGVSIVTPQSEGMLDKVGRIVKTAGAFAVLTGLTGTARQFLELRQQELLGNAVVECSRVCGGDPQCTSRCIAALAPEHREHGLLDELAETLRSGASSLLIPAAAFGAGVAVAFLFSRR